METFEEKLNRLIDQYLNGIGCGECCSLNIISFYSTISIEDAIRYACDYGKVKVGKSYIEDSHYTKLSKNALKEAEQTLLKIVGGFSKLNSFMEIYRLTRSVTENISGVNRMFYYDTSVRIAAAVGKGNEDLLPKDVFYQRGAELGAIKLGILLQDKIDEKNPYLHYNKFIRVSHAFGKLKPYQIEDFLCIYHDQLDFGK